LRTARLRVLAEPSDADLVLGHNCRVYGRSDDEWDELVRSTTTFLIERAQLRQMTSYTELNTVLVRRTGLSQFDFERADDRAAMGHLLGLVVDSTLPESGFMLSALVRYLNANDAGTGFYKLAAERGLLQTRATPDQKLAFWVQQVSQIHDRYGRRPS
jgi:hypothetical protein